MENLQYKPDFSSLSLSQRRKFEFLCDAQVDSGWLYLLIYQTYKWQKTNRIFKIVGEEKTQKWDNSEMPSDQSVMDANTILRLAKVVRMQ